MGGFTNVIFTSLIILATVTSMVFITASLYTICPIDSCDLSLSSLTFKGLFTLALCASAVTLASSGWYLYIYFNNHKYKLSDESYYRDIECKILFVFITSLTLMALPGFIFLGFYVSNVQINFWGAFFAILFLHINAGSVCQFLYGPGHNIIEEVV